MTDEILDEFTLEEYLYYNATCGMEIEINDGHVVGFKLTI